MYVVRNAATNWNKFTPTGDVISPMLFAEYRRTERIKSWQLDTVPRWGQCNKGSYSDSEWPSDMDTAIFCSNLKPSRYNFIGTQDTGESVIINFASEAIVILDKAEIDALSSLPNEDNNSLSLLKDLAKMGFFVHRNENERLKLDIVRARSIFPCSGVVNFTILPTQACNARCFYCFNHAYNKTRMSKETAAQVASFIAASTSDNTEIVYRWFGGEPLLARNIIDFIVSEVQRLRGADQVFHSIVTTNGILITQDVLNAMSNRWNVRKVHLTLDGLEVEHNRRKNYIRKGINGFKKTLENIRILLDSGMHVICRINLDKNNIHEFPMILDILRMFCVSDKFFVHATVLHQPEEGSEGGFIQPSEYQEVLSMTLRTMFEKGFYKDLHEILPQRVRHVCSGCMSNSVVVSADGRLFKCDEEPRRDELSVGNCWTGITHNDVLTKWLNPMLDSNECMDCVFLPVCQGGCKHHRALGISPCTHVRYNIKQTLDLVYLVSRRARECSESGDDGMTYNAFSLGEPISQTPA